MITDGVYSERHLLTGSGTASKPVNAERTFFPEGDCSMKLIKLRNSWCSQEVQLCADVKCLSNYLTGEIVVIMLLISVRYRKIVFP